MRLDRFFATFALVTVASLSQGCASQGADSSSGGDDQSQALVAHRDSDDAIKAKLGQILKDVTFMSESDYPFVIFDADSGSAKSLTTSVLRKRLAGAVKSHASSNRDISKSTCRAVKLSLADVLADASLTDPDDKDSRQIGLAVKYMTEQLKGVVGYTFGTNASGDQDEEGPVVYVYVGISRSTGKLIAIMTEAVYT